MTVRRDGIGFLCDGAGAVCERWDGRARAKCPRCNRFIAVRGDGTFWRHAPKRSTKSRLYSERARIEAVRRSVAWANDPPPTVVLLVRLWLRDYGGAQAFATFAAADA